MQPKGKGFIEGIILDNQRDLEIAMAGARQARPLRGRALQELYHLEGGRPPYNISRFTSEKVINGLKRIALRRIDNPYIKPESAENLLETDLGISLDVHRL
jgi:hypothetical protein